ncbi:MAG: hypothetical protein QOF83_1940 [Solirubrobacteraceae bacterium]|nr:hypothetical protein [Solirubrobacteraceae bacterium]
MVPSEMRVAASERERNVAGVLLKLVSRGSEGSQATARPVLASATEPACSPGRAELLLLECVLA